MKQECIIFIQIDLKKDLIMAVLTTLNITEKNDNNSLSVTVKVNITKKRSGYHYFIKRRCG